MAEIGRKSLVWDTRTGLFALSPGELCQVTNNVGTTAGQEQPPVDEGDPEGCFDHITSFIYSEDLLESEDTGMVQLLMLKDFIDSLTANGAL